MSDLRAELFSSPLPISPTVKDGLPREEEILWFRRLRYAKHMIRQGPKKEKTHWTVQVELCRNYLCAANYASVVSVSNKLNTADDIAEELESMLAPLLAHAIDTYELDRGKLSTHIFTVLINRGRRFARQIVKHGKHFRATNFKLKGFTSDGQVSDLGNIGRNESTLLSDTSETERRSTSESLELLSIAMKTAKLTNAEQTVIDLRFRQDLTLEEAGNRIKLTRERVRQIQNKALAKLKAAMET